MKKKLQKNLIFENLLIVVDWRNLITYCYIHNDSTVELSKCGTLIASFEVAKTEKVICKCEWLRLASFRKIFK